MSSSSDAFEWRTHPDPQFRAYMERFHELWPNPQRAVNNYEDGMGYWLVQQGADFTRWTAEDYDHIALWASDMVSDIFTPEELQPLMATWDPSAVVFLFHDLFCFFKDHRSVALNARESAYQAERKQLNDPAYLEVPQHKRAEWIQEWQTRTRNARRAVARSYVQYKGENPGVPFEWNEELWAHALRDQVTPVAFP